MLIEVVKVSGPETVPGKNGRDYKKLSVLYVDESGAQKTQNLVSFNNPSVFKALSTAQEGDFFEIKTTKTDRDGKTYYNWSTASPVHSETEKSVEQPSKREEAATKAPVKVVITEADRQRSIVRQSSIKSAVDFLAGKVNDEGKMPTGADVLLFAQLFEDFVNRPADARVVLDQAKAAKEVPPQAANSQNAKTGANPPSRRPGRPRRQVVEPVQSSEVESEEPEFELGEVE